MIWERAYPSFSDLSDLSAALGESSRREHVYHSGGVRSANVRCELHACPSAPLCPSYRGYS
jgi:hypothetical protein